MATTTINLTDVERLREVNKQHRLLQREHKQQPTITVTGTFPIAKYWDSKEMKKVAFENGVEVKDAVVEEVRVKWIVANHEGTTVYLKNEDGIGHITMTTK